jgi:hypothetical protein
MAIGGGTTKHRVVVVAWLKRPAQRFLLPNWLAITIWNWIFAWRDLDRFELAHELAHIKQWHEHGFFGYIRSYLAESQRAARAGGDRYMDNKFEIEARAAEEQERKQHPQ